jgi:RNA recognition motif-containing protein
LLEIQLSETPWTSEAAVPSHATQEKSKMGTRLFVGNLTFTTTEDDLKNLFGPAGTIVDIKLVTDRETGRSRGFAFVEMSSAAEANQAISQLNGRDVEGRTIKVNEAEERGSRSPRSGTGAGRW